MNNDKLMTIVAELNNRIIALEDDKKRQDEILNLLYLKTK